MSTTRSPARRVSVFNHKGGVGKTTLTVNLAFAVAKQGHRVLLIDSDPQCNLTSYLVAEDVVNDLLDKSDGPEGATIWSAVRPVVDGTGEAKDVPLIELPGGISLLPGDIRLAEFESELAVLWGECFQRRPRGLRGTTSLSSLADRLGLRAKADVILFDTGPNIGPLNRVILLDCDYFAVPVACDYFSLRAVKTLGHTLARWIMDWDTIADLAPDDLFLLPGLPKPIGYIPQRFKTRDGQPAMAYASMLPKLERAFQEDLLAVLANINAELTKAAVAPLQLGQIKEFGSLAAGAQIDGTSIWQTDAGNSSQRDEARAAFQELGSHLLERIGFKGK